MSIAGYTDEEVFYWYKKIQEFIESKADSRVQFCRERGLDEKKFANMHWRIYHPLDHEKEYYDKVLKLAKEWPASGKSQINFAREHGVHHNKLVQYGYHVRAWDAIDRMQHPGTEEREITPMKFIQVPNKEIVKANPIEHTQEVVEKQNDIEIIISKGVKVSISPNIESMKIIKIIELLKDL